MNHFYTAKLLAISLSALVFASPFVCGDEVKEINHASSSASKLLPQRNEFQRVLRDYLSKFTAKDFEVPVGTFADDESYLNDEDNLFRVWLLMIEQYGRFAQGLYDLPPEAFTLKEIESAEGVRLRVRKDLFPASLLFYANWDYPGNPLFNAAGIRNRALVTCIVDMIMLDSVHVQSTPVAKTIKRSDFLGGSLLWSAMVYDLMKDSFPPEVSAAYESAFTRFVDRLIEWKPGGGLGNIDAIGLVSMAYIERSVKDKQLAAKARNYASQIVDKVTVPAGYVTDGGSTDITYNGLALYHMAWAARIADWPFLNDAVRRLLIFNNTMSFPDPDGSLWGASHFSSRTSGDAANDQWAFKHRQYGLALGWPDLASYLVYEGQRAPRLPREDVMRREISKAFMALNRAFETVRGRPQRKADIWGEEHFDGRSNWAVTFYQAGEYAKLRAAWETRPDWTKHPLQVPGQSRVNLGNEVLQVRFPGYATLLHTAHFGKYEDFIYGLGGGTISTFWTPETGSVILSRRRGHQHDNPDRLDEWRLWPVHAFSGLTREGKMFSSARVRFPKAAIEERDAETTFVSLSGSIGDKMSAPDNALKAPITYSRTFLTTPAGLKYSTVVEGDGLKEIGEAYEVIPIFLNDVKVQPNVTTEIFFIAGGQETAATAEGMKNVEAIRVQRFHGSVIIKLDGSRTVKLSPEVWSDTYQSKVRQRNLMIDMTPTGNDLSKGKRELGYQIFGASAGNK